MKRLVALGFVLSMSAAAFSQPQTVCLTQEPGIQSSNASGDAYDVRTGAPLQKRRSSSLSTMIAYGSYRVGNEDRFGPMMMVQYTPNSGSNPTIDLVGGVLIRYGTSGPVDERNSIPVASFLAPYQSPYSNYDNPYYFQQPRFSFGLGVLGTDLTFYLSEGSVRPYAGISALFTLWNNQQQLNGTISPGAKAGLDVHINNALTGFAELRHALGVPNLIGPNTPKFGGFTAASFGVSFAPRLR